MPVPARPAAPGSCPAAGMSRNVSHAASRTAGSSALAASPTSVGTSSAVPDADKCRERGSLHRCIGISERLAALPCGRLGHSDPSDCRMLRTCPRGGRRGNRIGNRLSSSDFFSCSNAVGSHGLLPGLISRQSGDDQGERFSRLGCNQSAKCGGLHTFGIGDASSDSQIAIAVAYCALLAQRFHAHPAGHPPGPSATASGHAPQTPTALQLPVRCRCDPRPPGRPREVRHVCGQQCRNRPGRLRIGQSGRVRSRRRFVAALPSSRASAQRRGSGRAAQALQRVARHVRRCAHWATARPVPECTRRIR